MKPSDGKFRKSEHILKSGDFRSVYKNGSSAKLGAVVLCHMPNGLSHSRIGFSIGSGNIKLAGRRNRIKRLFREAYRRNKRSIKGNSDIVLIAKRPLPDRAGLRDAEEIFLKLIKSAGISA